VFKQTCTCGTCGKCLHREYCRDWRERNPESVRRSSKKQHDKGIPFHRDPVKRRAQRLVQTALRKGILERQPCEVCGEKADAHHDDYSEPLKVRWLCRRHHIREHVAMEAAVL
jgi:hypothetical protein